MTPQRLFVGAICIGLITVVALVRQYFRRKGDDLSTPTCTDVGGTCVPGVVCNCYKGKDEAGV